MDGRDRDERWARPSLPISENVGRVVGRVVGQGCAGFCAVVVLAASLAGQAVAPRAAVTEVEGESWIDHLHRDFGDTSMCKTGRLGPAPLSAEATPCWQPNRRFLPDARVCDGTEPPPGHEAADVREKKVVLHGSDVYRLNCRGCHGESGQGAPPEINSVINPVRATSVEAVRERMKKIGVDISRADAAELAQQSKASLFKRLHSGGQDMPPFAHLDEAEIRALYAYLKQLAGIAGAEREQVAVKESSLRIGEHIVKSTCHTCHSATGENPTLPQMLEGDIPPLSTLTERTTREEFVRKVTSGAPVMMGSPPQQYRGRMPVFYYLSEEEAADAYLYLSRYPPRRAVQAATLVAAIGGGSAPGSPGSGGPGEDSPTPTGGANPVPTLSATGLGLTALLLLICGIGFTARELRRLSAGRGRAVRAAFCDEAGNPEEKSQAMGPMAEEASAEDVMAD